MKIKLDENLPIRLMSILKSLGHGVRTVGEEDLTGRADLEIWEAAQKEDRFLITQDLDFSDVRRFAPGTHHGILLVRLRSPNRRNLIERVQELFSEGKRQRVGWLFRYRHGAKSPSVKAAKIRKTPHSVRVVVD